MSADRDDVRHRYAHSPHVSNKAPPSHGDNASVTPKAVAIPLPPLKASHIGYMWANTDMAPKSMGNETLMPQTEHSGAENPKRKGRHTESAPLPASKSSVKMPSVFVLVRNTLVAPILPEPVDRISISEKQRVRISPKGIDPKRYAKNN